MKTIKTIVAIICLCVFESCDKFDSGYYVRYQAVPMDGIDTTSIYRKFVVMLPGEREEVFQRKGTFDETFGPYESKEKTMLFADPENAEFPAVGSTATGKYTYFSRIYVQKGKNGSAQLQVERKNLAEYTL